MLIAMVKELAENRIVMSDTPPANPLPNQLWIDTSGN
jgi:hypothetical protein